MEGAAWRARIGTVEALADQLSPITGWEDQPLVTLPESTSGLPVKAVAVHALFAVEFGENYKEQHPADTRSPHQIGAVHIYTQAWAESEDSLYAVLNTQLANADRAMLKVWFLYIRLLMSALAFEPKYEGVVWRGVKEAIGAEYPKGRKFRWWRFSSCTEDGAVLQNPMFLGETGKRTLFSIKVTSGVKIQHLSAFGAGEAEVLIASGTRFVVANVITTGELTVVSLEELCSGLSTSVSHPPHPGISEGVPPQGEEVASLLTKERLDRYAVSMIDEGYAFVQDLLEADDEEIADLVTGLGMRKPEARRFSAAVAWRKAAAAGAYQEPEPFEPEPEAQPAVDELEPEPEPLNQQEQERATQVATFCGICGIQEAQAGELLAAADWDLQTAVDRFFSSPALALGPAPAPAPEPEPEELEPEEPGPPAGTTFALTTD